MKNITARVQLPAGEFILSQDAQERLRWSTLSGTALPAPDNGPVRLWDGCVDARGEFHLFLHTASRHLIHCHTTDGQHWQRQSLARLDRDDVQLLDMLAAALPELTLVYLLSGAGQSAAAVRYTQNHAGSWQGRRIELPLSSSQVSLAALLPSSDGTALYTVHQGHSRSHIFRTNPVSASALEVCSAPLPFALPQLLTDTSGRMHTLFISRDEVFADGYPLMQGADFACLYHTGSQVYCACRTQEGWQQFIYSPEGWKKSDRLQPGEPYLEIAAGVHQLHPPQPSQVPKAESSPAVLPSGITQTLHNQAVLLSALQESFRELQQQHFAVSAQVKALEAQQKNWMALKDRCVQLEQAMEALEVLLGK